MAKIRTMAAFMKADPHKRFGIDGSPVEAWSERACRTLQEMVVNINLKHKPMAVRDFIDRAWQIRELMLMGDGITDAVAEELVDILNMEWERARVAQMARRSVRRGRTEVARGRA